MASRNGVRAAALLQNRNPRNLERLRVAYKPDGFHLEKPGRCFWHKLEINSGKNFVTAKVIHYLNGPVVEASTSEWAIKKQLFKPVDTCAYINLGKILALRCLQFGITEMRCDISAVPGGKIEKFLDNVQAGGVSLEEPDKFKAIYPWDCERPEKPWEVIE